MKTIEVIVSPDGSPKVETHGFVGSNCRQASGFLQSALGQTLKETKKAEFFQQNAGQEQQAGSGNTPAGLSFCPLTHTKELNA